MQSQVNPIRIETKDFYLGDLPAGQRRVPLVIAGSGGKGHISAAEAIIESLKQKSGFIFKTYTPVKITEKASAPEDILIRLGAALKLLPDYEEISKESQIINTEHTSKTHEYTDNALDAVPGGHIYVAIWNLLHKRG